MKKLPTTLGAAAIVATAFFAPPGEWAQAQDLAIIDQPTALCGEIAVPCLPPQSPAASCLVYLAFGQPGAFGACVAGRLLHGS